MISLDDDSLRNFKEKFERERFTEEYLNVFKKENPLVSVIIPTYNRSDILINRSLRSVLQQTYKNLQIIVVGDCCTDNTEQAIKAIQDPRLIFKNRPVNGPYPEGPLRWCLGGSFATNEALEMSSGDFVTHLDDDDEYFEDRIEQLVKFSQDGSYDFVFHAFFHECDIAGNWTKNIISDSDLRVTKVTTSSKFYHKFFKELPWNTKTAKFAGDWDRAEIIKNMGPKIGYCNKFLLKHYLEGQNPNHKKQDHK
jgi:glycosyltransferase involved in cell wall biosynthesis